MAYEGIHGLALGLAASDMHARDTPSVRATSACRTPAARIASSTGRMSISGVKFLSMSYVRFILRRNARQILLMLG